LSHHFVHARFVITGKVQGVFFRASARTEAQRLGLRGHARNLPEGAVEVIASGDAEAVDAFETWLQEGPPLADVKGVERMSIDDEPVPGFRVF
jgi:acylphosphatase